MLRRFFRPCLVVLSLAGVACGEDAVPEQAPRAVKRRVDVDRIPVPNHSPQVMSDPGKPRRAGVTGKMESDVGGRRQHFTFFSRGKNAAAHFESTGVSWVRVQGALNDDGTPFLSFALEPLNLSTLELPATFSAASTTDPKLDVRYEVSPGIYWTHADSVETPVTLTLTSLEDGVLSGTFAGTLLRHGDQHDGDGMLELGKGTFEVALRQASDRKKKAAP